MRYYTAHQRHVLKGGLKYFVMEEYVTYCSRSVLPLFPQQWNQFIFTEVQPVASLYVVGRVTRKTEIHRYVPKYTDMYRNTCQMYCLLMLYICLVNNIICFEYVSL